MTYNIATVINGGIRDAYWNYRPSGAPEPFIAIQSGQRNFNNFPFNTCVTGNSNTVGTNCLFSTIDANGVADPVGGTDAVRVAPTATNVYHGTQWATLVSGGASGNLTAGDYFATEIVVKAGSLFDVDILNVGSSMITARFDLTAGTKTSGDSRFFIEPIGLNDPDTNNTGWYRIYTVGFQYDGTTINQNWQLRFRKGGNQSYLGVPATDNFYIYGGSMDMRRGYVWPGYKTMGNIQNPTGPDIYRVAIGRFSTPKPMTLNMEWIDRGNQYRAVSVGIMRLGDALGTAARSIEVVQSGTTWTATYTNASAATSISSVTMAHAVGDLIGLLLTINGSGAIRLTMYKTAADGTIGAATAGSVGNPIGLPSAWSDNWWTIGSLGYGSLSPIASAMPNYGDILLRQNFKIIGGVQPVEMVR